MTRDFDPNFQSARSRPEPRARPSPQLPPSAAPTAPAPPMRPPPMGPPPLPPEKRQPSLARRPTVTPALFSFVGLGLLLGLLIVFLILSWAVPEVDLAGIFHSKKSNVPRRAPASTSKSKTSRKETETLLLSPDRASDATQPAESKEESSPDAAFPTLPVPTKIAPQEPQLIAVWKHFVAGQPRGEVRLFSNGRINDPKSDNTWTRTGDEFVMHWPNQGAPGGAWVDRCTISPDEQRYSGRNQVNAKIEGQLVWRESTTSP